MTTFPAASYITNAARTEGEVKTALDDWLAATKQLAGGAAESTLTIAAGNVTPTTGVHQVDTEGAAATDDLTNILQTNLPDGSVCLVRSVAAARVVTVKHSAGGAGQVSLANGADLALRDPKQWLVLKRSGALWEEILRSPSAMFGTSEESGFVIESAKGASDRVQRSRYLPTGHGRLTRVSATQIKVAPFNGNLIPVKDANGWRMRTIPSAGILSGNPTAAVNYVNGVASQILAVSTVYLVCVFDDAGTLTFDFIPLATGHAADADTGVEIKAGDATRTLVGMIRTNGSSQFADSATQRFVISYHNRRAIPLTNNFSVNRTTTAGSNVEIHSEIRCEYVTWADEAIEHCFAGYCQNDTINASVFSYVAIDTTVLNLIVNGNDNVHVNVNMGVTSVSRGLASEGYHYTTLRGAVSGGTGLWAPGVGALSVTIRG